ncbi:UvsX RecA-like recombination protein [Delftia phage PhiW-14]|uniref:UvsX RecA-like recombination protein n=1 Tax=Delftia phage PhiW-14 TaxID=665032 RepID=C9DGK5_BPW14|nr:DNA repair protein [Delftia phage PhiW-14]ACV50256.1 UvsX RecA-like recombination protein [Delftia phage PhiW-14]
MATSSLAARLIKAAGKSHATMLSASDLGRKDVICHSSIPILNVMLSGELNGGITCGITQVVGDSRTFKTLICIEAVVAYLEHDPDAICIFFDCEFGGLAAFEARLTPDQLARVVHVPFEDLEDLKFQMTKMVENVQRGEKVIFFVDSVSQVASKKEAENALNSNEAADLTRAREMNSFFRIITPKLNIRNIPLFVINSYYEDTTSNYAEVIIKGGKQIFLSSDALWFVTRAQEKDEATKELTGWSFNYAMMKSRFCREKSKMSIRVTYAGGIDRTSSLLELARESGYLDMPTSGFYQFNAKVIPGATEKKFRKKELQDTANWEHWELLLKQEGFQQFVKRKFALSEAGHGASNEVIDIDTGEITKG